MNVQQSWCPTCREWTVIDAGRPCAFCDTPLVARRGGWKRPDLVGRINETAARAIHAKYLTGVSARTLGRELHQVLGYKTPATCENAIGVAFHRYGLPTRDRVEAARLASTTNGLSPRDWRERYRRRKAAGYTIHLEPLQPRCAGLRSQYPRKGERCRRPALSGSDYCFAHDPERRAEVLAIVEHARSHLSAPAEDGGNHRKEKDAFVPSP